MVQFSFPQSASLTLDGGVMVYGVGAATDSAFAFGLSQKSETRSLALKSGSWKFLAIGWDGPNKWKGLLDVQC